MKAILNSRFKPAQARQDVATKWFAYSINVAFHHHIFASRVWARGSTFSPAAGLKSGQFDRERNCAILA